ncbi:lysophospholipid acyltransferase family protein [Rickettsiales bacterium LUAb2]
MNRMRNYIKNLRLFTEFILAYIFYTLIKYLVPLKTASRLGRFLGYNVLGNIKLSRRQECINNIRHCFPEKSIAEATEIYKKSCANFIQTLFELPKLNALYSSKYMKYHDPHNVMEKVIKKHKALVLTAHYGNWEILNNIFRDIGCIGVYKAPNNRWLAQFFLKIRLQNDPACKYKMVALNRSSLMDINKKAKLNDLLLVMLVDQKIREGLLVNFMGKPAYTTPLLPMLSLKYNLPLVPIRIVRNDDFTFTIHIEKPIDLSLIKNEPNALQLATELMNASIEKWVREKPEQWFWLHRRW